MPHFHRCLLIIAVFTFTLHAQSQESDLRIMGYFQNTFAQETSAQSVKGHNYFTMQQLNLIAQKDLMEKWRAFVNLKMINNYSTEKNWGAFSVEEAWVRYRYNNQFNLKLGLQIPIFNSFNEIKDQTPLVPYVVKPLVYEDSYADIIPISDFIPRQAFLQMYGFYGEGETKLEYAVYLGNSPNISTWSSGGLSGIDTTETTMEGWRFGIRYKNLRSGVSFATDKVTGIQAVPTYFIEDSSIHKSVERIRIGLDFAYEIANFDIKGEYIRVIHDEQSRNVDLDKQFYYTTLDYYFDEKWFGYISYWFDGENFKPLAKASFEVYTAGAAMRFSDRITFKAQYALVTFNPKIYSPEFKYDSEDFHYFGLAASIFF